MTGKGLYLDKLKLEKKKQERLLRLREDAWKESGLYWKQIPKYHKNKCHEYLHNIVNEYNSRVELEDNSLSTKKDLFKHKYYEL